MNWMRLQGPPSTERATAFASDVLPTPEVPIRRCPPAEQAHDGPGGPPRPSCRRSRRWTAGGETPPSQPSGARRGRRLCHGNPSQGTEDGQSRSRPRGPVRRLVASPAHAIYAPRRPRTADPPDALCTDATVIRRVRIGAEGDVWPAAVLRGDYRADHGRSPPPRRRSGRLGDSRHRRPAHPHRCRVRDRVTCPWSAARSSRRPRRLRIDRAPSGVVRRGAVVGAAALVPKGWRCRAGDGLGVPAKLRRDAVADPEGLIAEGMRGYVRNGARYRSGSAAWGDPQATIGNCGPAAAPRPVPSPAPPPYRRRGGRRVAEARDPPKPPKPRPPEARSPKPQPEECDA